MNALEIVNLSKSFPGFQLEGLDLTLPAGCIMGFIGENGAGKSTTIKLILDILKKDSGTVRILGKDNGQNIRLTKEDVGVVPFKDFSRGMKMKLGIAIAMSHGAKLLLLDEATSGLDPVVRDEVVDMFMDYTRNEEHSIFISSHIVSDLEKLCDYIAFLHNGKLLLCEEKDKLLSEYGILHCTAAQLEQLDPMSVRHKKITPYGAEALVLRDEVPRGMELSPVSIEELFLFMVKEAH